MSLLDAFQDLFERLSPYHQIIPDRWRESMSSKQNVNAALRQLSAAATFVLSLSLSQSVMACESNLSKEQIAVADKYLSENRSAMAYGYMYWLAKEGSGGAYRYMANMLEQGYGVEKSQFLAREANWMGSQYYDPEAMYRAAMDFYARGFDKDGDYLAIGAKNCGHIGATMLLYKRTKAAGNTGEAKTLLESALAANLPEAKLELANAYDKGELGFQQDRDRAFEWYYLAAKDKVPEAMSSIAYYFVRGFNGVQDDRAAVYWYHQAAMLGHPESMTAYGWMVMTGKGAQKNIDEAKFYLTKAAKLGDASASTFLAQLPK